MNCPACRAEVQPGMAFCSACGAKVAQAACPACRQPVAPGATFCGSCGAALGPPAPAAAAAPVFIPPPPPAARAKSGGFGKVLLILVGLAIVAGVVVLVLPHLLDGDGRSAKSRTTPGKLDPSAPPVRFTQPSVSPLASVPLGQNVYRFQVENVSHCGLSAVTFAAILFDENGARLAGAPLEVGLAPDAGGIQPGDTYEGSFTTGRPDARRAVVVLKEVVYVYVPEGERMDMYRVPMKWTNRSFDAEAAAATPR